MRTNESHQSAPSSISPLVYFICIFAGALLAVLLLVPVAASAQDAPDRAEQIERIQAELSALLDLLAKRIGFRVAPGISERVVFRELYLKGLTALDLPESANGGRSGTNSHAAARREIQDLLQAIGLYDSESA